MNTSRREFLAWCALAVAAGFVGFPAEAAAAMPGRVRPLPLSRVRLRPSPFLDSVQLNRGYLLQLVPDRLLHNFRLYAGLAPRAEVYGGWESDTIAGHTLGHYLSALSLMHAQTGDEECRHRVAYIVEELAACQHSAGDGYVAGFTRKAADGRIESGRKVFEDIARGHIDARPFYLNGSWAPLYTWHKLFAGLLDAQLHCGNAQALSVAVGLGGYLERVFAGLDEAHLQQVLDCEFGGLNESFAELHARTGDPRWQALARRLHHHAVIDPLAAGQNALPRLHANTQIPKLIGLAREFELSGDPAQAAAARFFWQTVVAHHSYVVGGNADREYFQQPDTISRYITEQTCEHCNSYNMLKLTRHLYQWTPRAEYFDYYERTQLNHIMAQQHPRTGMFLYMLPLMAGEQRKYSEPFSHFWCCVGSGMESHAQFGDSIAWQDEDTLFVNLYIPSGLDWQERGLRLELESALPLRGEASLRIAAASAHERRTLALRVPGWAGRIGLRLNGRPLKEKVVDGYARVDRVWRAGDRLDIDFPVALRLEPTGDDPNTVALMHGPLVLAADLGPADAPWEGEAPPLVAEGDPLAGFRAAGTAGEYLYTSPAQPAPLRFRPFHAQHDRRSAVYLPRLDQQGWRDRQQQAQRQQAREQALHAQAVDWIALGEEASEHAHGLRGELSHALSYRRRKGRDVRSDGFMEFELRSRDEPLALRLRYWGEEFRRRFRILANGELVAEERLDGGRGIAFVDVDYPLPAKLRGATSLRIRIEPETGYSAGPAFGCWLLPAGGSPA